MNKKGFTLVELLTVIILLSLIALVTTPVVIGVINSSKKNLYEQQVRIVEKAAESWGIAHLKQLSKISSEMPQCYLDISELGPYLSNEDIKNPETGNQLEGKILIIKDGGNYSYKYKEDQEEGIPECEVN